MECIAAFYFGILAFFSVAVLISKSNPMLVCRKLVDLRVISNDICLPW